MNIDVFILFFNATFVTILSCVIVLGILRKQYLPVIKEEEKKQRDTSGISEQESEVKGEDKA
ncbi:hypothetical protein [Salinicoccus halitifaciens]|uniref:DUF4083 domain-containing protein n=1 Tax=Salinicoccus halitifaciens TaxID=1073415 RepID=A0ABV2EAA7_9STAP|nr:hypothetical protein [Salinicoccus halitifaciens]MCD2137857.1 hypothetical protein [Salinicoccus halitifaciens]